MRLMLTYVLLSMLADDYLPREYGGIYISPNGQPAIIDAGTDPTNPRLYLNYPTRYIDLSGIRWVPAGNYYGEYASNRTLPMSDYSSDVRTYLGSRKNEEVAPYFPFAFTELKPDVPKSAGTGTLTFEGSGKYTIARVRLVDKYGSLLINDGYQYVGTGSVIQMSGSYSSPKMKLNLVEGQSGALRTMDGSLEYGGAKYVFLGGRIYSRGSFKLQDPTTGKMVGFGWITWQPTTSRASEILGGSAKSTDRIIGKVTINGTPYKDADVTFTESP